MSDQNLDETKDWEYMSDFYKADDARKVRSFEEIVADTSENSELEARLKDINLNAADDELARTIQDVKRVKEASVNGKSIEEIALQLSLSKEYVTNILMTVQGYPEDNDFAVAHLVLMG